MALTKTKTDLVGSESGGTITYESVAGAGTFPSTLTRRDVTGKIGLAFIFNVSYGASAPATRPKLEIFTAAIDDADLQDTEAYETVEINTTTNAVKQITIPIRFAEDIRYISWKVTNGTTNAAGFYVAIIETSL